ncbi:unnamed protein product [Owenia fusiformis]|uniref:Uncharacterized protein n=1 Tax=Owenia fusiformis TaxID=6347 RepID=A0A8J1U7X7_OWEFU|nr:unnamed protein product [Owenia fusiformis]
MGITAKVSAMASHRFKKHEANYKQADGTIRAHSQNSGQPHNFQGEENPNNLVYKKMEKIIERMQGEQIGIPVRTVKSFMAKIPSVFTGADLVSWMMRNLDVDDIAEALHLASLISSHGYLFPIDDHILNVKNDNTYYRFQTPCFWPSKSGEPENTDYAVYLCKRTMQNKQRLELSDYEAENLARLQKTFSRKWEFIYMQSEAQAKVDKKRDKLERKVLDSQERAFWDVHRPMPGCVNTTEVDIKKACRSTKPAKSVKHNYSVPGGRISPSVSEVDLKNPEGLQKELLTLRKRLERRRIKVSKVGESYRSYYEQYSEFDSLLTPQEWPNPWVFDSLDMWEQDKSTKDVPTRRVKRWGFSVQELLKDPAGRDHFGKFLEKEFSGENLKFWEACQYLKTLPKREVPEHVEEIYNEFLGPGAHNPVNVDCRVMELVRNKVNTKPDRYCFDDAEEHIFHLMTRDSYTRYLRSDMYKEYMGGAKKKPTRSIIPKLPSLSIGGT